MGDAGKDDDLARELATTPPVKQMDNLGAAVEAAEKEERASGEDAKPAKPDKSAKPAKPDKGAKPAKPDEEPGGKPTG